MSTQESPENIETPADAAAPTGEGSPGAMIREARTRLRMSVEDLAASTKLARHTLEALERDDFNSLQEAVYVRGYYRKCAKILGLSEPRLVEAYNGRVQPKRPDAPAKLRLASGTEIGESNSPPVLMAVIFAGVAVLIGVVLWSMFKSPETPQLAQPAEESIEVETPPATVETLPPPAMEGASPATDLSTPLDAAAPGAVTPGSTPAPLAPSPATATPTPAVTPAPAAPAATGPVVPISLQFTSTSWARVEDASGKVLVNGLMREGESQTLRGQAPFAVFLGNGPGVKLEFEGRSVDFSRHIGDNLTARFKVPEGGN